MATINFQSQTVKFTLKNKTSIRNWLTKAASKEKKTIGELAYIFCNDEELLVLNQQFLNHDTLTDIITFDYSDEEKVSGEIYISIERVKENTKKFKVDFDLELRRVMIHGLLHLLGY